MQFWANSIRPLHGVDITIRHPSMIQNPFTQLTHCPLASGEIEINSKCCGMNLSLVLVDYRYGKAGSWKNSHLNFWKDFHSSSQKEFHSGSWKYFHLVSQKESHWGSWKYTHLGPQKVARLSSRMDAHWGSRKDSLSGSCNDAHLGSSSHSNSWKDFHLVSQKDLTLGFLERCLLRFLEGLSIDTAKISNA